METRYKYFDMPVLSQDIPTGLRLFLIELGRRIQIAIQDPPTQTEPGAKTETDSSTISDEQNGIRFTNYGATGPVTYQLPAAVPGLEYEFSVDSNYAIYIAPAVGERHLLGDVNQAITISAVGDILRLGCVVAGVWRIIRIVGGSTMAYTTYVPDAYGLPIPSADGSPILGA